MNIEKQSIEHYFSANPKSKHNFYLISTVLRGRNFKFFTSFVHSIHVSYLTCCNTQKRFRFQLLPSHFNIG